MASPAEARARQGTHGEATQMSTGPDAEELASGIGCGWSLSLKWQKTQALLDDGVDRF